MRRGTRQLRRNSFVVWIISFILVGVVAVKYGAFSIFVESPFAQSVYRIGEKFGLVNVNFPKETINKPSESTNAKDSTKSVLGTKNGLPETYYIYDEESVNPEDQEASGGSSEDYETVEVGGESYDIPAPKCTRGKRHYYVLKAEYVDNGMVLPASYVGFDKTAPEFVDPEKDKTAAVYQKPHREDQLTVNSAKKSVRKSLRYQKSRDYATAMTTYKNATISFERRAVQRVWNAVGAPAEKAVGKIKDMLYDALARAATIKEFKISLRFEGINGTAQKIMRNGCRLQNQPIILGAPNKAEALKYANAYNLPLASAVVDSSVLSRERNPGSTKQPVVYSSVEGRSLSTDDDRYYRYLLTTIGYDITMQADLPEDAGFIYKAKLKIKNWFNAVRKHLEDADRAVPLVAKDRNYTYVPMVCTCEGVAKRFNFKTFKIEEIPNAGTHYSCRVDFGKPILGNVDLPTSTDPERPHFNRGENMKVKMATRNAGDVLQSSKFTWVELAYINCRVDEGKAKKILEKAERDGERSEYGKQLIMAPDGSYKERVEVLHDRYCKSHGDDDKERGKVLLSSWLSNAGYFVQTVYFKLKPAESRTTGGGGSFSYGCSSDLVSGEALQEVLGGDGKAAAVQVLSFMDPRINTEMLLDRYKGGPSPKKAGKDDYDKQLSLLEKLVNFKAYVHDRYHWDLVGYVLTLDGDHYKLELRDLKEILGDADIKLPGTRSVYPLKF